MTPLTIVFMLEYACQNKNKEDWKANNKEHILEKLSFDISKQKTLDNSDSITIREISNTKTTKISRLVETDKLFAFRYSYKKTEFQKVYNKDNGVYLDGISLNSECFTSKIYASYKRYLVSIVSTEYLDSILLIKSRDSKAWNKIILSAHPIIKKILLNSTEGETDDYIIIYDLNI